MKQNSLLSKGALCLEIVGLGIGRKQKTKSRAIMKFTSKEE